MEGNAQSVSEIGDTRSDSGPTNAGRRAKLERKQRAATEPADFVPLHQESRSHVSTSILCWHLGRQEQTARGWACKETYPPGLRPIRVNGRLLWPVAGIRQHLGIGQK